MRMIEYLLASPHSRDKEEPSQKQTSSYLPIIAVIASFAGVCAFWFIVGF